MSKAEVFCVAPKYENASLVQDIMKLRPLQPQRRFAGLKVSVSSTKQNKALEANCNYLGLAELEKEGKSK